MFDVCVGPGDNVPAVYGLDVTDVSRWEEMALNAALQIVDSLSKVSPLCALSFLYLLFPPLFHHPIKVNTAELWTTSRRKLNTVACYSHPATRSALLWY